LHRNKPLVVKPAKMELKAVDVIGGTRWVVVPVKKAPSVKVGCYTEAGGPHVKRKETTSMRNLTTPRERMVAAADAARGGVVVEKVLSSK